MFSKLYISANNYVNSKKIYLVITCIFAIINIINSSTTYTYSDDFEQIATISICSKSYGPPIINKMMGHSFIYIFNTSDEPINIGVTTIIPNQGVTIGTTAMPGMEHYGIWYNVESVNEMYSTNVALTMPIDNNDVNFINQYISEKDKWTIFLNCSTFSTGMWNNTSAGKYYKMRTGYPLILEENIKKIDGHEVNKTFITKNSVFYDKSK